MKKLVLSFCLILLLILSVGCDEDIQADIEKLVEEVDDFGIVDNGDLLIKRGEEIRILEIDALPDSEILVDGGQRLLVLTDPSELYQHGILGDELEATSVTLVELSDQPAVISKFSVPEDWVIESILPIWKDWDGDGEREIVLTLSNSRSGAKLVLYDEDGNVLAESLPIGKGFRWRHALDIDAFGENGQMLLVDVQTPHIGGIVSFYSWDKENMVLKKEASLSGYSTHDIGSRVMGMYTLVMDEETEQILLILPDQSKTELAALRLMSGEIHEEWRISLEGKLSGGIELVDDHGVLGIRAIVDNNREVILNIPE